jgi:uncharacterized protein (DUF1499 family)
MDTLVGADPARTPLGAFAAAALGLAALAALALLISGPGNRLGWWDYRLAFSIMGWAAWGGAAGAAFSLVALLWAVWRRARRVIVIAVFGILIGSITIGLPLQFRQRAGQVPPIHDISTDTDNPPRFVALLAARTGAPNGAEYGGAAVAAAQKRAYPDIAPLMLAVSPEVALQHCARAAAALGWDVAAVAPADLRIEATDTTVFFGFKDDIVIRVSAAGQGSRVDIRSVSRLGRSDLGANARRVRDFARQLNQTPAR